MGGSHGDGGITKRKDGRLQVALTINGKRIYRTIPRMTDPKRQRRMAQDTLRELIARKEADLDPAGQTLGDFLRWWLDSMASATYPRRPNTIAYYRATVKHVTPALAKVPLDRLTVRHVQDWINGLRIAPRYVSHCRATLRRALNVAHKQRLIIDNPARWVDLPPIPEFRGAPLTADEAHRLLEAAVGDRLGALWRLALVTGFRSGELLALSWDDLDLGGNDAASTGAPARPLGRASLDDVVEQHDGGHATRQPAGDPLARRASIGGVGGPSVTIRHQLQRDDEGWHRVPTKAARDIERVAIDAATVKLLEAHRIRQAAERTPEWPYWGLVFTTRNGYPLDRHEVLAAFRLACDRAGIARRRFHDLRVSSATLLRDIGVAEDTRQSRLGHTTKAMSRHYAQASEAQDRDAVERLARAIG